MTYVCTAKSLVQLGNSMLTKVIPYDVTQPCFNCHPSRENSPQTWLLYTINTDFY